MPAGGKNVLRFNLENTSVFFNNNILYSSYGEQQSVEGESDRQFSSWWEEAEQVNFPLGEFLAHSIDKNLEI